MQFVNGLRKHLLRNFRALYEMGLSSLPLKDWRKINELMTNGKFMEAISTDGNVYTEPLPASPRQGFCWLNEINGFFITTGLPRISLPDHPENRRGQR